LANIMSTSANSQEKLDKLEKENAELKARVDFISKQLEKAMKLHRINLGDAHEEVLAPGGERQGEVAQDLDEEVYSQRSYFPQRNQPQYDGFKVELPEFEGRLDPDEYLEWVQTIERIFDYKE